MANQSAYNLDDLKSITIEQVEGLADSLISCQVYSWTNADAVLAGIAAMKSGLGYWKVCVTIRLNDGGEIKTRHDVKELGSDGNDLDTREHAEWLLKAAA